MNDPKRLVVRKSLGHSKSPNDNTHVLSPEYRILRGEFVVVTSGFYEARLDTELNCFIGRT